MTPSTESSPACTFLYIGMVIIIIPNTTTDSRGMVTTKINAAFTSMVKAMTMAPNTINGERRKSRSTILTPFCTWLTSEVMRVIMVEVPRVSISVKERLWI